MIPRDDPDLRLLQDRLLEATLPSVPFEGWSRRALESGAAAAGLEPSLIRHAFPRLGTDARAHFAAWADARMLEALAGHDLEALKVRRRVALALELRLAALAPHREAMRASVAGALLPGAGADTARALYRTVDHIWHAAGDRSTDVNFYTKRGLLAGVVAGATLYWLDDNSAGFAATHDFIARRIETVLAVGRRLGGIRLPAFPRRVPA